MSKMISQSCIYVGFIKNGEGEPPKSVSGSPSVCSLAVCVLLRRIPQGSLPSVALSASAGECSNYAFPISGAKVLLLSDMTKFLGRKIAKYVVKHKKEGLSTPFPLSNNSTSAYASN